MKDRLPTQVINGAVRMEVLDADGNHVEYLYLRRADEPTEEGTPYNVNNVLTDETANAIGVESDNPTPNQAFAKIAAKFNDLKNVNARLDGLETSTMFPSAVYLESTAFTAEKEGRYRFTLVGSGGNGGAARYNNTHCYGGGGGGAGAVCVIITYLAAGANLSFEIGKDAAIVGIALAAAGNTGGDAKYISEVETSVGVGGTGGEVTVYDNTYNISSFIGSNGGDGSDVFYGSVTEDNRGEGGNVTYYLPGQVVENEYSGVGFLVGYNLGYGGAGGWTTKDTKYDALVGGPAGIVVEFLG